MIPTMYDVPHSDDAEQAVIGALLLDSKAYDRIATILHGADFYRESHRIAYSLIAAMIESGQDADVVTVWEAAQKSGQGERIGGLAYLGEIARNTPSAANIKRYAEIVREKSLLRSLIAVGQSMQDAAITPDGESARSKLDDAQTKLASIAEGATADAGPVSMADALAGTLARMQDALDGNGPKRYTTGLTALDEKLWSYAPGEVVILAGRPGMGKTSLALQFADACANDDQPGAVAFFSLEMPTEQVTQRWISKLTGIELPRIIDPRDLTDQEWSMVSYATQQLFDKKIWIDDRAAQRPSDVRAKCNIIRRKYGLKLIVIDYLQLMTGKGENRTQEVGGLSRDLKAIAKDFGVPVVCLAQLSRKVEERANRRPVMSDLRESGDIEQDASLILFCYRDEVYNPDSPDEGTAELLIGKQRNGPSGDAVRVMWDGKSASFKDLDFASWAASRPEVPTKKPRRLE